MRIRPTELGWKGLLLLLALEAAFLATAYSNLFFLLIVFCVVLGSLGAFWTWSNLRGMSVVRLEIPLAAAGATRPVVCELRARRPRSDVHVELLLDEGPVPIAHAPLVAQAQVVHGTLPPRPRGLAAVRAVRLVSRFPLGLFQGRVDLPTAAAIATHPQPLAAAAAEAGIAAGTADRPHAARAASPQELRAFRTGDSPGDVHWKATARRGQPVVKVREREGDGAVVVVLDRRCNPEALERALSIATGLVLPSRTRGATVRLLSQDAAFTLGGDRGPADAALRWLAGASALPADAPPPPRAAGAVHVGAHPAESSR